LISQGLPSARGIAAVVLTVLALGSAIAPAASAATGSISGTVTGAPSHAGVPGVEVCVEKTVNEGEIPAEINDHCVFTAANGDYEIGSVAPGTYMPLFSPRVKGQNYLPRYYDVDGMWPSDSVTVGEGPTTGIDVELPEGGRVKGQVTEEVGGNPLAGVMVCAGRGWEHREPVCVPTDANGRYEIIGLWSEDYTLKFSPDHSGLQYFGEYYDDEIFGSGLPATPVSVTAGSVTAGIDAALKPSAEIQGVVTVAANGAPLNDILVCAAPPISFFDSSFGNEAKCGRTGGSGAYAIKGLEQGQYKVLFSLELRDFIHYFPPLEPEEDGYPTRYWNEKDTLWTSDTLTLVAPVVATGINARLGPPPPPVSITSPPPPQAAPPALKRKCKRGRVLRKVKGKRRCVRRHHQKHRRHKPPRQSTRAAGA
jgi:Carboxypeptidase regulatory-like domain